MGWHDSYGDIVRKTSQEVANCLNQILDNGAKLNGQARLLTSSSSTAVAAPQGKLQQQTPKWKQRINEGEKTYRSPSQKGQTWRQRNKSRQAASTVIRS